MPDNHRHTKVVNPEYQYREAFSTVLIAVIAVNLVIIFDALVPEWSGSDVNQTYLGYYIVGITELIIIIFCWKRSIWSTHRVAGPIYAIERELKKLGDGDLTSQINLRPKDEFQQAAQSINASISQLCDEIHEIKLLVTEVKNNQSPENLEKLEQVLNKFKTGEIESSHSDEVGRG